MNLIKKVKKKIDFCDLFYDEYYIHCEDIHDLIYPYHKDMFPVYRTDVTYNELFCHKYFILKTFGNNFYILPCYSKKKKFVDVLNIGISNKKIINKLEAETIKIRRITFVIYIIVMLISLTLQFNSQRYMSFGINLFFFLFYMIINLYLYKKRKKYCN